MSIPLHRHTVTFIYYSHRLWFFCSFKPSTLTSRAVWLLLTNANPMNLSKPYIRLDFKNKYLKHFIDHLQQLMRTPPHADYPSLVVNDFSYITTRGKIIFTSLREAKALVFGHLEHVGFTGVLIPEAYRTTTGVMIK